MIRKDVTKFMGEIPTAVFQNKDGDIGRSMIVRDISESKQAEETLQREKDRAQKYLKYCRGNVSRP